MEETHWDVFSFVFWGTHSNLEPPLMYEVSAPQQGSASGGWRGGLGSSITACKKVTLPGTSLVSSTELEC